MNSKLLLSILLLILISCSKQDDQRILEIDKLLNTLHAESDFSGNVLISEEGRILYEKSFGLANRESRIPHTSESIFDIFSVSKTFTGVAIMLLEEQGHLSIDDNIKEYFPDFPYENITVKNLLTHTSGLYRIQHKPFKEHIFKKELSNKEIIAIYKDVKPKPYFDPGEGYEYANTNYILLGMIIEKISGLRYYDFVDKHIVKKSGMSSTFYELEGVPKDLKNRTVSYYRKRKWLTKNYENVNTIQKDIDDVLTFEKNYGESDIHTTTGDLYKFHTNLINGKILKKETLSKMYEPYLPTDKDVLLNAKKSNYPSIRGMGWNIADDTSSGKIVCHAGGDSGGRTFFIRNISKNQCIIILNNNTSVNRYTYTALMKIMNKKPYKLDTKSLSKEFAEQYLLNGIDSAVALYNKFNNHENYTQFIDWDFEEIGLEFMEKDDLSSAIKLFELYTLKFPKDEWSFYFLGDAYNEIGNTIEAKENFQKCLEMNPDFKYASDINKIINQN